MDCTACKGTGDGLVKGDGNCSICDGSGSICDECGEACDSGADLCESCLENLE